MMTKTPRQVLGLVSSQASHEDAKVRLRTGLASKTYWVCMSVEMLQNVLERLSIIARG